VEVVWIPEHAPNVELNKLDPQYFRRRTAGCERRVQAKHHVNLYIVLIGSIDREHGEHYAERGAVEACTPSSVVSLVRQLKQGSHKPQTPSPLLPPGMLL